MLGCSDGNHHVLRTLEVRSYDPACWAVGDRIDVLASVCYPSTAPGGECDGIEIFYWMRIKWNRVTSVQIDFPECKGLMGR